MTTYRDRHLAGEYDAKKQQQKSTPKNTSTAKKSTAKK